MITLSRIREIEPSLRDASDEEVAQIRDQIYGLAQLAYDCYKKENDSKFPMGSLQVDDMK
tara:strand:+ start:283 stop:462 length:180 start_codon:yes stop_codon:yes gene_type:complete